jgi:hypothetical protein
MNKTFQLKNKYKEEWLVWILLGGLLIFFITLALLSQGSYGGADDLNHYRLSRYAFLHPEFFFDQWGKPLFILFTAPFAQLGYFGMKLFNILCGLGAAFFAYKSAQKLGYNDSIFAILMVIFAPIFTALMLSGMTEIFFAFLLIFAIYLFLDERIIVSAIIVSFLPFARIEGFIIIVIFLFLLVVNKKWKAIPFLCLGFLIYSLAGYFVFKDLLWAIHTIPYSSSSVAIYGKGDLLYYVKSTKLINGVIQGLLIIPGTTVLFTNLLHKKTFFNRKSLNEFLLVFAPYFSILVFHSLAWWLGTGALALTRLIAIVIPCAALLSLKGFNWIKKILPSNNIITIVISAIMLLLISLAPFQVYNIPVKLGSAEVVIKEACDWYKKSEYKNNKFHYYDPYFFFLLDINPYDNDRVQELIPDKENPEKDVAVGSLVLWDAHYSPNEGRLSLDKLMKNEYYKLLKVFKPQNPFTVLGGYSYEVYVFQRVSDPQSIDNNLILDNLNQQTNSTDKIVYSKEYDFEKNYSSSDSSFITTKKSKSGYRSFLFNDKKEYGCEVSFIKSKIHLSGKLKVKSSVSLYFPDTMSLNSMKLVLSVQHKNDIYFYKISNLNVNQRIINQWFIFSTEKIVENINDSNDLIKVYIWNSGKKSFYVDDFQVECSDVK